MKRTRLARYIKALKSFLLDNKVLLKELEREYVNLDQQYKNYANNLEQEFNQQDPIIVEVVHLNIDRTIVLIDQIKFIQKRIDRINRKINYYPLG